MTPLGAAPWACGVPWGLWHPQVCAVGCPQAPPAPFFGAPSLDSAPPGRGREHPQLMKWPAPVHTQLLLFGMLSSRCPQPQNCHSSPSVSRVCMKGSYRCEMGILLRAWWLGGHTDPTVSALCETQLCFKPSVTSPRPAPAHPRAPGRC